MSKCKCGYQVFKVFNAFGGLKTAITTKDRWSAEGWTARLRRELQQLGEYCGLKLDEDIAQIDRARKLLDSLIIDWTEVSKITADASQNIYRKLIACAEQE